MRPLIMSLILVLLLGCSAADPQRAGLAVQPVLPQLATPTPLVRREPSFIQDSLPILDHVLAGAADMSEMDKIDLQQAYEDYRANVELLSQILKENDDATKEIINNLRDEHGGADWTTVAVFLTGFCTSVGCDPTMREFADEMCVAFSCKPEPTPTPK